MQPSSSKIAFCLMMKNGELFYLEMIVSMERLYSLFARPGSIVDPRVQRGVRANNKFYSFLDRLKLNNLVSGRVAVVSPTREDRLRKPNWWIGPADTWKPIFKENLALQSSVVKSALALITSSGLSRRFSGSRPANTSKLVVSPE